MNDSQNWSRTGNNAETQASSTNQAEESEVEIRNNVVPSQWWFATTAFPLLAGTFGPVASAFNICALTQGWRESTSSNETEDHGIDIPNPTWIVVANAVSLALAVAANLTLLSKFSRGPSFLVAHSVVIVGWYISSFLMITTIAVASTQFRHPSPHDNPPQDNSPADNSYSQAFYYACFATGLYFVVSSLMLVSLLGARSGYYSKEHKRVRSDWTLACQTISFKVYLLSGAVAFSKIEKWNYLDAVFWADCTILTVGLGDYAPKTHLGRSVLFPYAIGGVLLLGLVIASMQSFVTQRRERRFSTIMKEKQLNLLKRLQTRLKGKADQEDFKMLRDIQHRVAQQQRWILLFASGTSWFVLWFLSAAIFKQTERDQNWSYFQALYFTFTSLMTIGYGDLYPVSNAGKPFFVFWSLLAVPTITILIGSLGGTIVQKLKQKLTLHVEESGRKKTFKCGLRKATKRQVFDSEHRIDSPQNSSPGRRSSNWRKGKMRDESTNPGTEKGTMLYGSKGIMETGPSLGKDQPSYHYLLINEISNVTVHLLASPSREYTFDEWAWFRSLTSRGDTRSIPPENLAGKADWVGSRDAGETEKDGEDDGSSSSNWWEDGAYLRSGISETQWMLEHLIATLKRELRSQMEEHR